MKCAKCRCNTDYKEIRMDNGKIMGLCKTCHEAWGKLFNENSPKCESEPYWTNLWNFFIEKQEVFVFR